MKLTKTSVCLFEIIIIIIIIFKNWQVKQFSSITLIKLLFRHIAIIIILYLLSLKLKSIGKQTTITPCFTARWQVFIYSSPKQIDKVICVNLSEQILPTYSERSTQAVTCVLVVQKSGSVNLNNLSICFNFKQTRTMSSFYW